MRKPKLVMELGYDSTGKTFWTISSPKGGERRHGSVISTDWGRVLMRKGKKRGIPGAAVAAVAIALSLGWFINRPADVSAAEVKDDTADVHIVQTGENLWDICRPLADARGMDIREVIYLISVNNGINQDASLKPGQRITLRF